MDLNSGNIGFLVTEVIDDLQIDPEDCFIEIEMVCGLSPTMMSYTQRPLHEGGTPARPMLAALLTPAEELRHASFIASRFASLVLEHLPKTTRVIAASGLTP